MVETQGSYVSGGYMTDFHSPELYDVQRAYDISTGKYSRSYQGSYFDRPGYEIKSDANYFLSGFLGGDHSTKFGIRYKSNPYRTSRHMGGGATARFTNGVPAEAEITRDQNTRRALWAWAGYFNDSYNRKPLAHQRAACAFDYQKDKAEAATVPASAILPGQAAGHRFRGRRLEAPASSTSRRGSASPTTCAATARRSSRPTSRATTGRASTPPTR